MHAPTSTQGGLSLVELLVGITVGLFIVASGSTLLAGHLRESRALQHEARLMQDLRNATEVITRDLRRAGHWGAAASGVWSNAASGVLPNPYAALAASPAASDAVGFRYSRDSTENQLVDSNEQFGFRLRNGAVEMQLGLTNWQALTDAGTLTVTAFNVTPQVQPVDLQGHCLQACAPGATSCPPRLDVRSLALHIAARSVADAQVTRRLDSRVRLRNDPVHGACPV